MRILAGGRNQPVQLRHEEALAPQVDRFEFSRTQEAAHIFGRRFPVETGDRAAQRVLQPGHIDGNALVTSPRSGLNQRRAQERQIGGSSLCDIPGEIVPVRSEEHTSELQSLMRISYAVFCLKKKKNKNTS